MLYSPSRVVHGTWRDPLVQRGANACDALARVAGAPTADAAAGALGRLTLDAAIDLLECDGVPAVAVLGRGDIFTDGWPAGNGVAW